MSRDRSHDGDRSSGGLRRWAIRIGIALLVLEIVYVIGANVFLRSGMLMDLINKRPEKTHISWDSVTTYLPGFATVTNFELRSQSKVDQFYVRVAEADARIALPSLVFKTVHIKGVDARDVDFRYRQRLDRPPKPGREDEPRPEPANVEFWPEIPGLANPPDPKPEDLYPKKKNKQPWTIKISGADVEGPIRVALNAIRIESDGFAGGSVTIKPKDSIAIRRGRLGLDGATVTIGGETVSENLAIHADVRMKTFPAKGPDVAEILGGISGELSVAGRLGERLAVRQVITPGISIFGAGTIAMDIRLKDGVVRAGSTYSLQSEQFHLYLMGLEALGSATVAGETVRDGRRHLTRSEIDFGEFRFLDPDDGSVDISGDGFDLDAVWDGLSIARHVPATHVELVLPTAEIHDVSTFNSVIPEQVALSLVSGTGEVAAMLEVNDQVASGTLDVSADEVILETDGTPLYGDLEVRATVAEGDLATKRFDLSGTTVRLDDIVDETLSEKKQAKLEAWYCDVLLQRGTITVGKPTEISGSVEIRMFDTRAVLAALKKLGVGPKWIGMAPNIKDVAGSVDVEVREDLVVIDRLSMTGDGFESLGWMRVDNKTTNARLFAKFKAVAAGVAIVDGKTKVILAKPRKWFDEQPAGAGP